MANYGLFIGFGFPARGREQQAAATFQEALQYYGGLQQRGELESVEAAFLEPHGGELGGYILLRGEIAKLNRIRYEDPEFQRLLTKSQLHVENVGVVAAQLGDQITEAMNIYMSEVAKLG
jgi:hypothetical protein